MSRWRIFRRPTCCSPNVADKLVLAGMCLHNYLKSKNDERLSQNQRYCSSQYVDRESDDGNVIAGEWRDQTDDINLRLLSNGPHRASTDAYEMRNSLTSYFLTPSGEIP